MCDCLANILIDLNPLSLSSSKYSYIVERCNDSTLGMAPSNVKELERWVNKVFEDKDKGIWAKLLLTSSLEQHRPTYWY